MMQQTATNYGSVDGAVPPRLVLASSSPRRRELLALLGLPFVVVPSRYVEPDTPAHALRLADFVTDLAINKAREVAGRTTDGYVIGADTLVTVELGELGTPLGKPANAQDASRMLELLSGRVHCVYTGVAIVPITQDGVTQEPCTAAVRTLVKFRQLDAVMIADYVATGEPLDKAGAYGAQGYAAPFIESFEGDFYNVVGLPLSTLGHLLESLGVSWWRYRQQMPALIG